MWKLNDILLSYYGIVPGQVEGEGLAVKGIFDLPARLGIFLKDWDDQNSVEPYVDADEIFLTGRDIIFHGILEGTKAQTEAKIELLKSDIDVFNSVVPFETPYGSFCVYVKDITSEIFNGIATILVKFREPVVGAVCGVAAPGSIYYSAVYTESANKNNCPTGYYGLPVSLSSTLGQFTSVISQIAANQLAIDWVRENKQINANIADTGIYCAINPPIYFNVELTNYLQKNDCPPGYVGSYVSHTIPEGIYSSDGRTDPTASQAKANAKAQAAMDAILTQDYANAQGTCSFEPYFKVTKEDPEDPIFRIYYQDLTAGPVVVVGSIYWVWMYGIPTGHVVVAGDTAQSIVVSLAEKINNKPLEDWYFQNQAPLPGSGKKFPPQAFNFYPNVLTIWTSADGRATPDITFL